jgi:hypothetical protein
MSISQQLLEQSIQLNIQQALQEDIGDGDITALLTPEDEQATATIISREDMILAGQPWVNALIAAFDPVCKSRGSKTMAIWFVPMKPFLNWRVQHAAYLRLNALHSTLYKRYLLWPAKLRNMSNSSMA